MPRINYQVQRSSDSPTNLGDLLYDQKVIGQGTDEYGKPLPLKEAQEYFTPFYPRLERYVPRGKSESNY